jgi:transcription elongation factor GreA
VETLDKTKYYVTAPGAERLRREFDELEQRRAQVTASVRHARSFGDLSENFEYHEAKREQGLVEGRLQQLRIILPSLEVVQPGEVSTAAVGFGAVVTVREESGDTWDLTIVGPLEADPMEDRISYESPLGKALWGAAVGQTVEASVPAGTVRYEIVAISPYQA